MANRQFKSCGVLILESVEGDIMIADPSMKYDIVIRKEIIDKAQTSGDKARILTQQFAKFFISHREKRWLRAAETLQQIKLEDAEFVARVKPHTKDRTVANLRKIEKDIFYWKRDNGKLEITIGKK